MKNLSFKYKIYILLGAWLVIVVAFTAYIFDYVDKKNQAEVEGIVAKKKDLLELQAEQRSYQQGITDLELLSKKEVLPSNFFSSDTSLVNEIKTLENLAEVNNLKITITIGGTANTLPKAKTSSDLLVAPYSLNLTGNYLSVLNFIRSAENLSFITQFKNVNIQNSGPETSASINSVFYIKSK